MDSKTSELETGAIPALLLKMAVPIIIAGLVNSLYQLIDAYFVTHYVGPIAMSGIAITMPLFLFVTAVVAMISSGGASFLSRYLGAKDHDHANKMLGAIVTTGFVTSSTLAILFAVFLDDIFALIGMTPNVEPYALEYTLPYLFVIPVFQLLHNLLEFFRVEGRTQVLSILVIISTVLNIALDAVFIVGLEMGVTGAIYATIASVAITLVLALINYIRSDMVLSLQWKNLLPAGSDVFNIFKLGLPTFMGAVSATLAIGVINITITTYAADAADFMLGAFGVVYRVLMFVSAPIMGIAVALQTVSGFNYGAKRFARVKSALLMACVFGTIASAILATPVIISPEVVYAWFSEDPELIKHASAISVFVFLGFLTKGISSLAAPFFQALGNSRTSFILSLLQGFIVLVPTVILFSWLYGIDGVSIAILIADVVFLLISLVFLIKQWVTMGTLVDEPENTVADSTSDVVEPVSSEATEPVEPPHGEVAVAKATAD